MEPAPDRDVLACDVFCPRCRYNLRGLPGPRCPECGLTFPPEQWASGVLREHLPTWLDRCDPWQPHQVLVRSLFELFRGAWRPRWVLTKLDLNGPLTQAAAMLVCGTLWLYVIATVLIAAATMLHTGASPYASLKSAGLRMLVRDSCQCWCEIPILMMLVRDSYLAPLVAGILARRRAAGRDSG